MNCDNANLERMNAFFERSKDAQPKTPPQESKGKLNLSITTKDGQVIMDFGTRITWFGMDGNQAIDIGNLLVKFGRHVNKNFKL